MPADLLLDAKLSKAASTLNNSAAAPANLDLGGWTPLEVKNFTPTSSNFAAQLFVSPDGSSYKVAFRATKSLFSSGDTETNVQSIGLNNWTPELTDDINFTKAVLHQIAVEQKTDFNGARAYLSTTGHSQAGFEAEMVAKFFGLRGTSLDGPGAAAITQSQAFADKKAEAMAAEPQLQADYAIGEFVARRYTFLVGGINGHVDGVATDNSFLSLTASAVATLANPIVGLGVQAQFIHNIDGIIECEAARKQSTLMQILVTSDPDSLLAQIGGTMYPATVADGGNGMVVTPDANVMAQISDFIANHADATTAIYAKGGVTYVESTNGGSLFMRADGSGERFLVSANSITQEILGAGSIVTNRVVTEVANGQTKTEAYSLNTTTNAMTLRYRMVQTVNGDSSVNRDLYSETSALVASSTVTNEGITAATIHTTISDRTIQVIYVPDGLGGFTVSKVTGTGSQPLTPEQADGMRAALILNDIDSGELASGSLSEGAKADIATVLGDDSAKQFANELAAWLNLVQSIRGGKPLSIVASAANIAVLHDAGNIPLSGVAGALGTLSNLYALQKMFQEGDFLGTVATGSQLVINAARLYAVANGTTLEAALGLTRETAAAGGAGGSGAAAGAGESNAVAEVAETKLFGEATEALKTVYTYAAAVYIVYALSRGDVKGAAIAAAYAIHPVAGVIMTVLDLFGAFDDEEPTVPFGKGIFYNDADGTLHFSTPGALEGEQPVKQLLTQLLQGDYDPAQGKPLGGLYGLIQQNGGQYPNGQSAADTGLIAQRMPQLVYEGGEFRLYEHGETDGIWYLLTAQPLARYDAKGQRTDAAVGSDAYFQGLGAALVDYVFSHKAVAPLWEVLTARMQGTFTVQGPLTGEAPPPPEAPGLSEYAAAASLGKLAPAGATPTFHPIPADLGFGIHVLGKNDASNHAVFDIDDSGYLRKTAWAAADTGLLYLDRNANAKIDNGTELFSNAQVADELKGLASLKWIDANRDGVIDEQDPVFGHLHIWVDKNSDGRFNAGDAQIDFAGLKGKNLKLDYVAKTYSFLDNGITVTRSLSSNALEADAVGSVLSPLVDGNGAVKQDAAGNALGVYTSTSDGHPVRRSGDHDADGAGRHAEHPPDGDDGRSADADRYVQDGWQPHQRAVLDIDRCRHRGHDRFENHDGDHHGRYEPGESHPS